MRGKRDDTHDPSAGHRHARLEGILREEVIALVRDETTDPDLEAIRIGAVSLSVDYRHARVHFALVGTGDRAAAERALARATSFFRARLAETIDLKRVPDLRFIFDAVAPDPT